MQIFYEKIIYINIDSITLFILQRYKESISNGETKK